MKASSCSFMCNLLLPNMDWMKILIWLAHHLIIIYALATCSLVICRNWNWAADAEYIVEMIIQILSENWGYCPKYIDESSCSCCALVKKLKFTKEMFFVSVFVANLFCFELKEPIREFLLPVYLPCNSVKLLVLASTGLWFDAVNSYKLMDTEWFTLWSLLHTCLIYLEMCN